MNSIKSFDTAPIIAVATGTGNAGVGILRISGSDKDIRAIYQRLFPNHPLKNRYALLLPVRDRSGEILDRGIILYFEAPFSYTGESVLELQMHGGRAALELIQREVLFMCRDINGLRLANPGEFTERAFLNGKIDLVQAEATADLIEATSVNSVKAASRSLTGEFSKIISTLNNELIDLRVEVEAILDFPDEEIEFINQFNCLDKFNRISQSLDNIIKKARQGVVLREGLRVAIIGETNVGKSSLLNYLAGEDIAIVSNIEGTTRDKIQTTINVSGIPFHFIDTAGIRETEDSIEKIGIERSKKEIVNADIILLIEDIRNSKDVNQSISQLMTLRKNAEVPVINVFNKSDLVDDTVLSDIDVSRGTTVITSTVNGHGIDELKQLLIQYSGISYVESTYSARERHIALLNQAKEHLKTARNYIEGDNIQLEFFAEELREAADNLGEIIGKTTADELLGKIFSGFCIGK